MSDATFLTPSLDAHSKRKVIPLTIMPRTIRMNKNPHEPMNSQTAHQMGRINSPNLLVTTTQYIRLIPDENFDSISPDLSVSDHPSQHIGDSNLGIRPRHSERMRLIQQPNDPFDKPLA